MKRLLMIVVATCIYVSVGLSQAPPPAPRLVLVLAIDQMRFDYLTRFAPLYTGGLRALVERGAVFANAKYRHASSETGPGHAVLLSGRHPSHSGIVANEWCISPEGHQRRGRPVSSPSGRSRSQRVAGERVELYRGRRVEAAGRELARRGRISQRPIRNSHGRTSPDAAYWYEVEGGNFITSTYYATEAPSWLVQWNRRRLPDQFAGKPWTRLLADEKLYEKYAGPDAVEGEWDRKDIVFPHVIRGNPPDRLYYDDFRRTPFADEVTLSVALEATKAHQLGQDRATDIFAVGFSATDVVGHTTDRTATR